MDEITFAQALAFLSAIGFGSIATTFIQRWFSRGKDAAEAEEILARTNKSISEIVEQKTEALVRDYQAAMERIHELEEKVQKMKLELDGNRQVMKIRSLEADVEFYKSRVEVLEAQNLSLVQQQQLDDDDEEG